jgi:hypothetical protein
MMKTNIILLKISGLGGFLIVINQENILMIYALMI